MRESLRALRAFLVRDALTAFSYRLEFGLNLLSVLFYITGLYFLSTLIGSNAAMEPYGGYLPFAAIGMAVANWFRTGFDSFAKAIQREQMQGTLEALLLAPLRIPAIVVSCSAWRFLWATVISLLYVTAAVVLYDVEIRGSVLLALAVLFMTTVVFAALGVISASFVLVFKRGDPIGMLIGGVSTVLGGVFYPVAQMPEWLQYVAYLLPITHGLDAIRAILLQGAGAADVVPQLVVLSAFASVLIPLGLWCFQRALRRAQREGTLLHY